VSLGPLDGWSRVKITTVTLLIAALACTRKDRPASHLTADAPSARRRVPATITGSDVVQPVPVGGDVKPPVAIIRVEPRLPKHFDRAGPLLLAATIDRTGAVRSVRVVRDGTLPKVGLLYVDAIKQWRFKPGTLNGEPVDVEYNLSVIIDVR
jgi:hypothetical protein